MDILDIRPGDTIAIDGPAWPGLHWVTRIDTETGTVFVGDGVNDPVPAAQVMSVVLRPVRPGTIEPIRAADLPDGSVVGHDMTVYLRRIIGEPTLPWQYTEGESMYVNYASDDAVDEALAAGATVLRVGTNTGRAVLAADDTKEK